MGDRISSYPIPVHTKQPSVPGQEKTYLLPQSGQPLLLGVGIDIGPDNEGNHVEERHPSLLRQELLRERQRDGRHDPADAHDGQEARAHGGAHLVEGARAGDDGHGREIDRVLDGRHLRQFGTVSTRPSDARGFSVPPGVSVAGGVLTTRLLTRIWKIFAFKLVRPANSRCKMLMSRWPSGALMKAP